MKNAAHLTSEQLTRYQERNLEAVELLAADRHVSKCGECRNVLFERSGAHAQLSGLRSRLSEHLTYDQVAACAGDREDDLCRHHIAECATCRAEVEDLREFRATMSGKKRQAWVIPAWSAAAAALLAFAGLAWWNAGQRVSPAPQPGLPATALSRPPKPTEPDLAPEQRDAVQLAMTNHKLDRAPVLDR